MRFAIRWFYRLLFLYLAFQIAGIVWFAIMFAFQSNIASFKDQPFMCNVGHYIGTVQDLNDCRFRANEKLNRERN